MSDVYGIAQRLDCEIAPNKAPHSMPHISLILLGVIGILRISFVKDGFTISKRLNPEFGGRLFSQMTEAEQTQLLTFGARSFGNDSEFLPVSR